METRGQRQGKARQGVESGPLSLYCSSPRFERTIEKKRKGGDSVLCNTSIVFIKHNFLRADPIVKMIPLHGAVPSLLDQLHFTSLCLFLPGSKRVYGGGSRKYLKYAALGPPFPLKSLLAQCPVKHCETKYHFWCCCGVFTILSSLLSVWGGQGIDCCIFGKAVLVLMDEQDTDVSMQWLQCCC